MEFPHLGENCSEKSCNKLDFLPMKCDSCKKIFCQDHFKYEKHSCEEGNKHNVQVPVCPLCGAPVPGHRGEAPDVAVSLHLDNDCQTDIAKQRRNKIYSNKCSHKGCKGKEMVALICPECALNFCLKHRHAVDHNCEGKLGMKRRMAAKAAEDRVKSKTQDSQKRPTPQQSGASSTDFFPQIQGQMSEDEALARALSLSMQETTVNPQPSRPRVGGGDSDISKCNVS